LKSATIEDGALTVDENVLTASANASRRPYPGTSPRPIAIGSDRHRDLFCATFMDSRYAYDPVRIAWPSLTEPERARLVGLPFWTEAVEVESVTSRTVADAVSLERDPLIREAIAVQAEEEARHAALLRSLFGAYDIPVPRVAEAPSSRRPMWAFYHSGIGECFDSFFAFGLFALARQTGFLPPALIEVFEPVMQEEVRHIQFFVNWAAYRRARAPLHHRPAMALRTGAIVVHHALGRLKTARSLGQSNEQSDHFTLSGAQAVGDDLSLGAFLDLCLSENDRRFAVYDPRLLRPRFMPETIRCIRRIVPGSRGDRK
jgi:hypothetical protein